MSDVTDQDLVEDEERPAAEVPQLDPEALARRREALKLVRQFGDPVLKSKARPIQDFDDDLRLEVQRMGALMEDSMGIGLAAPQLGVPTRLLVYRLSSEAPLAALVNPVLEWSSKDSEVFEEGCLSLPAVHVDVERPIHVRVRALDEWGESQLIEASGLEARVIQHEMDHLDGILILDRTSRQERKEAMRAMREAQESGVRGPDLG
ncbi:peptide deformylase [Paraconexibacter sp.]|uniref:peptide deformylase n=1 Tax=Paraconexibacter sp. TaxID=2949640 RepID=UPI003566C93A